MKFNKIFWLEDNPEFIKYYPYKNIGGRSLDISQLLQRTCFAFDFETGREIVSNDKFDLYILDGDFPNKMGDKEKEDISDFLRLFRVGSAKEACGLNFGKGKIVYDNFVRFYKDCLVKLSTPGRVIVNSMSLGAMIAAFRLGLPFYYKHADSGDDAFLDFLRGASGRTIDKIDEKALANWERGSVRELLERYLIE